LNLSAIAATKPPQRSSPIRVRVRGKHHESLFTKFYQGYILPTKFGVDKRRAHLSDRIRNGEMTRDEALTVIETPYTGRADPGGTTSSRSSGSATKFRRSCGHHPDHTPRSRQIDA
jgi:hypothetical protein